MLGAIPWVLLSIPFASAMAEFFVPGPPPYQRWRVGEVQKIRFRTTYTKYTIALWQQLNGAAKPGPILFQTTSGPDYEFNWSVHSYNLDLDISDKFYLWLFEGGPSAQGNTSIKNSQSSGFFYISATPITTTSSSPLPSSAVPSRSLSAPIVQATPSCNSKATGEIPQNNSSAADGDLSVAAKASIGVGAGVAGLAILSATLLFAKYRSKMKKELAELRSANCLNFVDPTLSSTSKTTLPTTIVARQPPSELLGNDGRPIAELG